jgi:hypothetical protein
MNNDEEGSFQPDFDEVGDIPFDPQPDHPQVIHQDDLSDETDLDLKEPTTDPRPLKQSVAGIPFIQIPQDDRLDSYFATELGRILSPHDIYQLHDNVVQIATDDDGINVFRQITAEKLCTLIEDYCTPFRIGHDSRGREFQVLRSLSTNIGKKIVTSPQLLRELRKVRRLNSISLPIIRPNGNLELLAPGYDAQSAVLTLDNAISYEQISKAEALAFFKRLLAEFPFYQSDRQRAISVVIAQILTLFCAHIFPPGTLRPGFLFTANEVGSGKTLLAKLALIPILGHAPAGTYPEDETEMRKRITTAILTGRPELFWDNAKHKVAGEPLEALMTTSIWIDRLMGGNRQLEAQHNLTVIITGNDARVGPDMMRRLLPVELFNPSADNADRKILSWLDGDTIRNEYRAQILSAAWTLVQDWHNNGQPEPKTWYHDFRGWTRTVCGIIENAGLETPCSRAELKRSGDRDGADIKRLIQLLDTRIRYTLEQLGALCEQEEIFEHFTVLKAQSPSSYGSAFGKFLSRYDGRRFPSGTTFHTSGPSKHRRYHITIEA